MSSRQGGDPLPLVAAVAVLAAAGLAPFVAVAPMETAAGAVGVTLVALVAIHPPLAAYVFLGTTPLIVGIDRGELLPLLRPNEGVLLLLWSGLGLRWLARLALGQKIVVRYEPVQAAILLMAVTSSVLPLLWLTARGEEIALEDLLYALTLWKYYGVYLMVRISVTTERQVHRCLHLTMAASAVVAVIAILQSLGLFGVTELLSGLYAPFEDRAALEINRGTSTLASSIAVADVMAFSTAIAVGYMFRNGPGQLYVYAWLAGLFAFGGLSSGQFSGIIALVVVGGALGLVTGRMGRAVVVGIPTLTVAGLALAPVIQRRLEGFSSPQGLPRSWIGRLENLQTFFWPRLFTDWNYLLGVRPAARVPAPESWREWVWIESGHTWLLWNGGIPFFLSFLYFMWVSLRQTWAVARRRADAIGVAGVASFSALCVIAVLMVLDPHLTMRGSADLSFPLLAMAATAGAGTASAPRRSSFVHDT